MARPRVHLLVVIAALAPLAAPAGALGADSDAPPGAGANWLPDEEWVRERWLPFDESRLARVVGLDARAVRQWVRDDSRTLDALARSRGVPADGLAARLVEPRRDDVRPRQWRRLRDRTARVLDQGHLAQHLLRHPFHNETLEATMPAALGVTARELGRHRSHGMSPAQVAVAHGRDPSAVQDTFLEALKRSAERGVRRGATSERQARSTLARARVTIGAWMARAGRPGHAGHG